MESLHPNAGDAIERKIASVKATVQTRDSLDFGQSHADPDAPIQTTLTEDDLAGLPVIGFTDEFGEWKSRWIKRDHQFLGLDGEGHRSLREFCAELSEHKSFRDFVSRRFLEDKTFDWLTNHGLQNERYSAYIQRVASDAIGERVHWVPVAHLIIEQPIRVGHVTFRRNTRKLFDDMEQTNPGKSDEERQAFDNFIQRERARLQRYTSGTVTITAEPIRARERAREMVEVALGVLRLFDKGSMDPRYTSYVVLKGQDPPGTFTSFTMADGIPFHWSEEQATKGSMDSVFRRNYIAEIRRGGLDSLSRILGKTDRSDYETKLIEAILMYSRVSISPKLSDKLVYMLVALEFVFLRNSTEPIQKNLGERLAFLIGKDLDHRKAIVRLITEVYHLRSRLLHHGQNVSSENTVAEFQFNAWNAFLNLILNTSRFSSIDGLLGALDDRKLS